MIDAKHPTMQKDVIESRAKGKLLKKLKIFV